MKDSNPYLQKRSTKQKVLQIWNTFCFVIVSWLRLVVVFQTYNSNSLELLIATPFEKAAVYLRDIIGDHPFSDGNKRTALTVCGIFLARNGQELTASPEALEDFTVKVATDHLGVSDIAMWLRAVTANALNVRL